MKTFFLFVLLSLMACTSVFSQVLQKKIVSPVKPAVSPVGAKPLLLNAHNPAYLQKIINHSPAKGIEKMIEYSKTFTYSDNSKLHISLRKNPSWAGQGTALKANAKPVDSGKDPNLVCSTNNVTLTATSTDFMNNNYSPQTAHIYPGAIYTYEHLYDGSFREENADRNPIIIGTDNPNITGDVYETVAIPNQTNIANAIARLFSRFRGPAANESTSYQVFESSNTSDLNIKVGAAGSGYGFSFNNVFNTNNQEQHLYLTVDARKTLFSIGTPPPPDSGYFKNNANASAPMVILGSVSYGVRILANLDYTFKSKEDMDAFKAAYSGFGVSGNVDLNVLSKNTSAATTVNAYIIGGPSAQSKISFSKDQLQQQLESIFAGTTYQNARPVSYELFDMNGNVVGEESATDEFVVRQCVPAGLLQSPHVTFRSADDGKDKDTHYTLELLTSNNKLAASYSNNSNNDAYAENTSRGIDMQVATATINGNYVNITPVTFTQADFTNGGRVHLSIVPIGHDTWRIGSLEITLNFSTDQHVITWSNVVVSQDSRDIDLYFDAGYHAKQ